LTLNFNERLFRGHLKLFSAFSLGA